MALEFQDVMEQLVRLPIHYYVNGALTIAILAIGYILIVKYTSAASSSKGRQNKGSRASNKKEASKKAQTPSKSTPVSVVEVKPVGAKKSITTVKKPTTQKPNDASDKSSSKKDTANSRKDNNNNIINNSEKKSNKSAKTDNADSKKGSKVLQKSAQKQQSSGKMTKAGDKLSPATLPNGPVNGKAQQQTATSKVKNSGEFKAKSEDGPWIKLVSRRERRERNLKLRDKESSAETPDRKHNKTANNKNVTGASIGRTNRATALRSASKKA